MTFHNCQRLLKHFNNIVDGTIPPKHNRWDDVIANAKVRAKEMEKRLAWYNSDAFKVKHGIPIPVKEVKKEVKKSGSSGNRS